MKDTNIIDFLIHDSQDRALVELVFDFHPSLMMEVANTLALQATEVRGDKKKEKTEFNLLTMYQKVFAKHTIFFEKKQYSRFFNELYLMNFLQLPLCPEVLKYLFVSSVVSKFEGKGTCIGFMKKSFQLENISDEQFLL